MAVKVKLDLKTAKLALKVSRTALTKAVSEFDWACQELDRNKDTAKTRKIRLAATLIDTLESLNMRVKKMVDAKDVTIETIIGIPDEDLSKPKDELVTEIEVEHDKYIKNVKDIKTGSEDLVTRAEEFLVPQVENISQPVSTAGTGAEMFKPQANLKPNFLDKQASHLEIRKFCQGVDVYIQTGFSDTPPQKVWPYIGPLMHVTWSNSLELNGVKEKYLSETLEMLLEESQLRNPVHNRQIDFLTSKRGGMARHTAIFLIF